MRRFIQHQELPDLYDVPMALLLHRPVGSQIYRTINWPFFEGKTEELVQVLNTISLHKRPIKDIYFFLVKDSDDLSILHLTLYRLDVPYSMVENDLATDEISLN